MTSKVEAKSSELVIIFYDLLGWNFQDGKIFVLFICMLCKVQTVSFDKLATDFNTIADIAPSFPRTQLFRAKYQLYSDEIARLIFRLPPHKPPYPLYMNSTNWNFGELNINVLVITVIYQSFSFPLIFKLLPKAVIRTLMNELS